MSTIAEILAEANSLLRAGRPGDAVRGLRRALESEPQRVEILHKLGVVLAQQNQADEAVALLQRAYDLAPDSSEVARDLRRATAVRESAVAAEWARRGRFDQAIAHFRRAVELEPGNAGAHNNLGLAYAGQGQVDEAFACYDRALSLKPDYVDAQMNRANALMAQDRLDEARAMYEQVLAADPRRWDAHLNVGYIQRWKSQFDQALASFERVVHLKPDDASAHFQRGLLLLTLGRFAEGWDEFEWRWKRAGHEPRPLPQPLWSGTPLAGRTVLAWTEEGYGDSLHFIRYAALLKQQGATVIVECEAALARLFSRCPDVDRVVVRGEALPAFDAHVPLMSLPSLLRTRVESIPANVPYLSPDPESERNWCAELANDASFKVGVAWRGNPRNPNDRWRSMPRRQFAGLARTPGVRLYSLQTGPGRDELWSDGSDVPMTDLGDRLVDFHDTAAAMRNLDLVVTCDSAPAHLAGALGVPVWVALPFVSDWRWLLDRDDSPWYPTMRLFRQTQVGDWNDVFRRICDALVRLV